MPPRKKKEIQEEKEENARKFSTRFARSQLVNTSVIDLFMSYLVYDVLHMGIDSDNIEIENEVYSVKDLQKTMTDLRDAIDIMMGCRKRESYDDYKRFHSSLYDVLYVQKYVDKVFDNIRKFYKADNVSIVLEIPHTWVKTAPPEDLTGIYILQDFFKDVSIEYY